MNICTTTEVIIINNPRSCRLLRVVEKGTVDDDDKGGVISPRLLGCRLVIRNRLVLHICCSRTLLGSRCVYAYRLKEFEQAEVPSA